MQAIAIGRYVDELVRLDGTWRFSSRDYTQMDLVGDLSHHVDLSRYATTD